jgi:DNA-binding transcriptional MerR regulator
MTSRGVGKLTNRQASASFLRLAAIVVRRIGATSQVPPSGLDLQVDSKDYRRRMTASLLISDLAARSGFTASTLRYYEQVGLLAATERSSGGYRLYDEAAVARLRFIDRAKQLGLPLDEIRELVAVWDGGLCAHVQDRLRAHITTKSVEVRDRIADLTLFAGQLDEAGTELAASSPDGPCREGCGCADPGVGGAANAASAPQLHQLTATRRGSSRRLEPGTPGSFITAADPDELEVPVACTLGVADQPGRLAAWTGLLAAVQHRERVDGGLRLVFAPDPEFAARLADLATREQQCCSFFTFTLRLTGQAVELDVTAPPDAAGVVADLFGTPA